MIIEDQESFKSWLSAVLEPLCDADPVALAKYVFALVKKDKPPAELRTIMIEQLDVFLQQETKNFVDLLFKTLETQAYSLQSRTGYVSQVVPQETSVPLQTQPPLQMSVLPEVQAVVNHQVPVAQTNGIPAASLQRREADSSSKPAHRKSDSDKEEKARRRHKGSTTPPPSRGRSRSRSWERSRRSRSRGRERDRSRAWRNKSPPPGGSGRRRRTWSRSPPPSGSNRSRGATRSRSRSPRYVHRSSRSYRNRSPPHRSSMSRSRSHSIDRSSRDKKEALSGAATPTQDSNHGDVDMRLTTTSQSIQSVVSACTKPVVTSGSESASSGQTFVSKRRCRDFDEKGYCMRGDLCPYDHGNDPVVLEDVALSRVLAFGPGTGTHSLPSAASTPPAAEHVAPPPAAQLDAHPPSTAQQPPPPPPSQTIQPSSVVRPTHMEYNPDAPSMEPRAMWGRQQFRGGQLGTRGGTVRGTAMRSVAYNPQPQRELISVPVTDELGERHRHQQEQQQMYPSVHYGKRMVNPADHVNSQAREMAANKKAGFDFNRLGPRHKNPNNCSLELKKVPRPLNNITHLNNHFSKFGKIVNIQVSYEGDPEAAIVTFSSHAEAYAAYRSTEAVLNNRFIKVFWHNSGANNEAKQENVPPPPRPSVKDRLGMPIVPSVPAPPTSVKVLDILQVKQEPVEKVIMSGNNLTKTVYIPTALKKANTVSSTPPVIIQEKRVSVSRLKTAVAVAAIKKTQEMLAAKEILKKKQEEKRKEALKITADLRKKKQELLEKQLAEQKALIERLEKCTSPEQREVLMTTIKKLQETIEQNRKELSSAVLPAAKVTTSTSNSGIPKKSVQEAQREILDAELDLFTRQQEGGDTSELKRRIAELKMAVHSLGLLRPVTRTTRSSTILPHRTAVSRGRGRGYTHIHSHAHVSVDHRPTKVLVSGYEEDEKDDVVSHFSQFGEIIDYVVDESTPSLVLNYKSRKEAEVAILKGRSFQDRLLSVTWCGVGQPASRNLRSGSMSGSLMSTVHLHAGGGGHRQVVLVGNSANDNVADDTLADDDDELGGAELNDVLLQDDEEEEEDGEDRSWRR